MPEETNTDAPVKPAPVIKLVKGQHTNATMRQLLAQRTTIELPNGKTKSVPATGIIYDGRIISDPDELPSDAEIAALRKDVVSRRSPQS